MPRKTTVDRCLKCTRVLALVALVDEEKTTTVTLNLHGQGMSDKKLMLHAEKVLTAAGENVKVIRIKAQEEVTLYLSMDVDTYIQEANVRKIIVE